METGKAREAAAGAAVNVAKGLARLLAVLALLVLGLAPGARVAAQAGDEETYESPQYGYTLTYDADEWEVVLEDEDEDDDYDTIALSNGISTISVVGDPDYDEDELEDCVDDYLAGLEQNDNASDIEPSDERDAEGADDDVVWATYTYTFAFDSGDEADFARYFSCTAVGDGLTLVVIHDAPVDDYEDEVTEREDLLEGLGGISASDEEDEDRDGTRPADDDDEQDQQDQQDDQGQDDEDQDDSGNDAGDDAEVADGKWEGETEDGEPFSLTILDGGVSSVSYAYECNGEPIFASAAVSDPAPIADGEFEFETETSNQTTVVVGTFTDGEAEGTLTHETEDEDECSVELDWTVEEP